MECTVDNNFLFPPEILTEIFGYVDPHTLVFSCRHVCRLWRETVECPVVWKIKIFQKHGHKFATDSALSKAHLNYPWYICYALCRNVFNRNLYPRSTGILLFWRDAGVVFPDSGRYPPCSNYGRTINCIVDLYAQGLTRKIMELQPPIHIIDWHDYNVHCHIGVRLYDSEWRCCSENGSYTSGKEMGGWQWMQVCHTFTNYSPDVRYVVFLRGIRTFSEEVTTIEYTEINLCRLTVGIPKPSGPSDSSSSNS